MFSLKKMVNDNICRKNRLILPRAVIPVRGVDQEEHEFLFFADQSGMQHNERINKFLNQQQHNIHWNGFKDFHWHQQHQEGLEPNDQYCDVNIHRSGLHLQGLSEKETWEDRQKYSFTRTKSASQCLSSSPLPQRKEPNQKIKKFLTWPWTAVIQRILW